MTEFANERNCINDGEKDSYEVINAMKAINELPRVPITVDCVKDFYNPKTIGVFDNIHAYIENRALHIVDSFKSEVKPIVIEDYLIFGHEHDALGMTIIMGNGNDLNFRMTSPDM